MATGRDTKATAETERAKPSKMLLNFNRKMKRLNFYFVVFALIAIVFNSCKKDDDSSPSSSGSFTVKGKTWNAPNGFYETSSQGSYIMFTDAPNPDSEEYKAMITLFLNTTSIVEGTYTYTTTGSMRITGCIAEAYDGSPVTQGPAELTSGNMVVKKVGNTYEISYTLNMDGSRDMETLKNGTIVGTFKGELKQYTGK